MYANLRVDDLAAEVWARQARALAERTGEPFEAALEAVLKTEVGRQLLEPRDGPHRDGRAERWQEGLPHERARKSSRVR